MFVKIYKFFETLKNSPAKKDKALIVFNSLSLLINISLWFFLYFLLKKILADTPEITTIPLHYNVYFGIDYFGHWKNVFMLPGLGLIIFIINLILSFFLYSKKILASYFLSLTALFCQIIFSLAGLLIILINL